MAAPLLLALLYFMMYSYDVAASSWGYDFISMDDRYASIK